MALVDALGFSNLLTPSVSRPAARAEVDEDRKVRLGMFFYVLSDLILAVFFFASYIFLRGYNTNDRWVPPSLTHVIGSGPVAATGWITLIAVVGAVAYGVGQWALYTNKYALFTWAVAAALLLYFADGVIQLVVILRQPYDVSAGSFASAFGVLAGYHVYHMALAVFLGVGVVIRAMRGLYRWPAEPGAPQQHAAAAGGGEQPFTGPARKATGIAAIGYYWHYAALYAIATWLLLLIAPP